MRGSSLPKEEGTVSALLPISFKYHRFCVYRTAQGMERRQGKKRTEESREAKTGQDDR